MTSLPLTAHAAAGRRLLRAILEEPARDDLRLIYADWLEDQGEIAHAAFVRDGLRNPLNTRVICPDWCESITLRRGMVEAVSCEANVWLRQARRACREHPITRVNLTNMEPGCWKEFVAFCDEQGLPLDEVVRARNLARPYFWNGNSQGSGNRGANVSALLRRHWPGGWSTPGAVSPSRDFITEDEALAALSVACVNYGRARAGLPSLP